MGGIVAQITTGFDGRAGADLAPGRYRLQSAQPLTWEKSELTWDLAFEVTAGKTTSLEISSDNATKSAAAASGRVTDEGRVFQQARDSVFLVEADSGHGSGFLVDPAGLIITNYHVVGQARYIAVKLDARRKYSAQALALDKEHDIGVVRVNPEIVKGIRPLTMAGNQSQAVIEGERVVAIGSPLTQESVMTTGVVSKVQPDAIISDVNINPGNSGGPLLNLEGAVLGVNTFGISSGQGPGMSGVVRIHLAQKALAEARQKAKDTAALPVELLPVASEVPYPAAALREMITADPEVKAYNVEAGKIDVMFRTPPLLHSLAKHGELKAAEQQKKRREGSTEGTQDPRDDLYAWRQYGGDYEAVVTIKAMPEIKMTGGSKAGLFFGAGSVRPIRYRFKVDFREMVLQRGGVTVRPILPGRICETVSMGSTTAQLEDVGCYGFYQYPPEAFASGEPMTLRVFTEDAPDTPIIVPLDPALVYRISTDFKPFFEALKKTPGESASGEPEKPPDSGPGAPGSPSPPGAWGSAGESASPEASASPAEEVVAFNKATGKYHCLDCASAKQCTVNCVNIPLSAAVRRGGVPCKVCGGTCGRAE
jgi:S1-C subfamily serine protease